MKYSNTTPKKYMNFINFVLKDLGIEDVTLQWYWYQGKRVGMVSGPAVGWANSHKLFNSAEVAIALNHDEDYVLDTIAHELRHIWQTMTDTYTETVIGPKFVYNSNIGQYKRVANAKRIKRWNGSNFAPTPMEWCRKNYDMQPDEIDANKYAEDAVRRFKCS